MITASDVNVSELESLIPKHDNLTKEHETLKIDPGKRFAALTSDHDSKTAEVKTIELDYKRSIDSARSNGQFWKAAHDNLQEKHIITKNAFKALTVEHTALAKEFEITKEALAATENTVKVTETTANAASEQLESARNAHTLTKRTLDSERSAHSSIRSQFQFLAHSHGVTYEQLQVAHTTIANLHTTLKETQKKLTTCLSATHKIQRELEDERDDHQVTRQTGNMITKELDATRKALATLQVDITVASQENSRTTSTTRDTDITLATALADHLHACLRDTGLELANITQAHQGLKKTVTDLQSFKDSLACTKDRDCTSCPMHMRQAFHVARANEAETNKLVDEIQDELFRVSSELQDYKHANKEKAGMFVDMGGPQNLSSTSSTMLDSGSGSREDSEGSDDDSVDIYTGPTTPGFMKTSREDMEEVPLVVKDVIEDEDVMIPASKQPKLRDGHRFVQRTLFSHLGIGSRPSKLAQCQ
jgi:chaperonin cofactor prefoldin